MIEFQYKTVFTFLVSICTYRILIVTENSASLAIHTFLDKGKPNKVKKSSILYLIPLDYITISVK